LPSFIASLNARFRLCLSRQNEIACQMSDAEIAAAQRAARDWLVGNCAVKVPAIAA
jgi:hypothetical protein